MRLPGLWGAVDQDRNLWLRAGNAVSLTVFTAEGRRSGYNTARWAGVWTILRAIVVVGSLAATISGCLAAAALIQLEVTPTDASRALEAAIAQVGAPYVLGGQSPEGGFDCSGLIVWAYQRAVSGMRFRVGGMASPDASMVDLWSWNVDLKLPMDLIPGDVVFLADSFGNVVHGGLFVRLVGDDALEFVNASSHLGRVAVDQWPLVGEKRGQRFAGAGRLKVVVRNVSDAHVSLLVACP